MKLLLLCSVFLALTFHSCDIINPDEQVPAYVNIDSFTFTAGAAQGTSSSNITDMWVYANGDIQGVFAVPSTVPVLRKGNTDVLVFAGIKNDGISSTRIKYPFYTVFDTTLNLEETKSHTIHPHFRYADGVNIDTSRDFESFQAGSSNDGGIMTGINDPAIAFEGSECAKAYIEPGGSFLQFVDDGTLSIPSGTAVFLEMDYSANNLFSLGVLSLDDGDLDKHPIIYITPTTTDAGTLPTWNKIYIDLGQIGLDYPNAAYHRLYIECYPSESTSPTLFFDNLKIVRWQS